MMISYQKNIKPFELRLKTLNALPAYDDRHRKTKIRTFGVKVYTDLRGLNVPEDIYEHKYYLQVDLDDCAYKNYK